MAQKPGLTLRPAQRTALAPGLQAGLGVLALPLTELWQDIERQAQENPFLVIDRPASAGLGDADMARLPEPPTLARHLKNQIALMDLPVRVRALALYLCDDLDERGLLPAADAEIAAETAAPPDVVASARAAVQACEPSGVGATDLADCIRLQLIDDGMAPAEAQAVRRHLGLIAEGRRREAAAALGLTPDAVEALAARIARLSPDPAAAHAAGAGLAAAPALVPELAVETGSDGRPRLRLLDDPAAAVTLDEALAERALRGGDDAGRAFVATQRRAARELVSALAFRRRALLRVGEALVEAQSAYFLGQARAPSPLRRADLAVTLGLHPSTVGRTLRGRSLLFRGEVRPLASFFPPALFSGTDTALSAIEIQARIREMIGAETPERPLSDSALAAALQDSGVDIARRTVAKYRQCLHIPSSSRRRRRALAARGGGR
jgi:RNA polymerase sigma-54 factor